MSTGDQRASGIIRIFLADDHTIVREGIKSLINAQPDLEVVGEAADGEAAISGVLRCRPDVAVLDLSMPRLNGTAATLEIKRTCPETHVLALTMYESKSHVREVMSAGASGYVLKRSAAGDLVQAIRVVLQGGTYLDPSVAGKLVADVMRAPGGSNREGELSEREMAVLRLIAQGYSNKEVAAQLKISVKTVETYKARSMEKLNLNGRVDIVRYALERGWLADV